MHIGFWWETLREKDHLEDPGVGEDNIKIDLQEVEWGMDWIDLADNGGRWRAHVNAVMNLRVP